MFLADFSGNTPSFFSSTMASFAMRRARARWSALSSSLFSIFLYGTISGVEHPESDARSKQTNEGSINRALGKVALLHRLNIGLVIVVIGNLSRTVNALIVHAALQGDSRGLRLRGSVMVISEDIANRFAVRNYISLEMPRLTKR